ncbi:hypothetical protein CAC42_1475 [Sphaceloma murrayae]|uniref:Uncharacterized protein n=1 Tax=Sphaceloma murrayae TaxID=2082308 RepID=A0A2K1QYA2_9PEZI|nr:hypothetical protein CAC42_1475 [Sphaceloma murrayae]
MHLRTKILGIALRSYQYINPDPQCPFPFVSVGSLSPISPYQITTRSNAFLDARTSHHPRLKKPPSLFPFPFPFPFLPVLPFRFPLLSTKTALGIAALASSVGAADICTGAGSPNQKRQSGSGTQRQIPVLRARQSQQLPAIASGIAPRRRLMSVTSIMVIE